MIARRRILARRELGPALQHASATTPGDQCPATIELDGTIYRCGRGHVDGIHDAFREHHDGGAVRW
ncbi:MAG: hypothetical protein ABR520_11180 [Mycobacteriales bacterium]|nr:hypothetical protein [Actinomycetota bacterium]